jgi:hypothetical protein
LDHIQQEEENNQVEAIIRDNIVELVLLGNGVILNIQHGDEGQQAHYKKLENIFHLPTRATALVKIIKAKVHCLF